jgi:hypothetical protein
MTSPMLTLSVSVCYRLDRSHRELDERRRQLSQVVSQYLAAVIALNTAQALADQIETGDALLSAFIGTGDAATSTR